MSDQPTLQARNLVRSFGSTTILNGVNLSVAKGETVAIMGRSGEGKTTLLHILGTLDTPTSGELYIDGTPVSSSRLLQLRRSNIGFIFQGFHLIEHLSALENILQPARIARRSVGKGSAVRTRALQLAEAVGITHRLSVSAGLLSGGERQRVAIARAMMNQPAILFADEPTGNLDHDTAACVQDLLFDAVKREGSSLVLVTHDPKLAHRCDRCVILENGQLSEAPFGAADPLAAT